MTKHITPSAVLFRYSAYGLSVESTFPLPELERGAPLPPDAGRLVIRDAPVALTQQQKDALSGFVFEVSGSTFWWEGVGAFHVSAAGDEIRIDRPADVGDDLIAFPLLGPVLSEVLRRRGLFALHASAAEIDGAGVALLADKGTGKSSTVGALLRGGARLLSDDLVAIDPASGLMKPGFAQIKVDAANLTHQLRQTNWVTRPHVHDRIDKVRVLLPDGMAQGDIPTRTIYVLERGTDTCARFQDIPPSFRLPALVRFSFAPRFGKEALRGADGEAYFRAAIAVCERVTVRRLKTPVGLERLDSLIDDIRADLNALPVRGAEG